MESLANELDSCHGDWGISRPSFLQICARSSWRCSFLPSSMKSARCYPLAWDSETFLAWKGLPRSYSYFYQQSSLQIVWAFAKKRQNFWLNSPAHETGRSGCSLRLRRGVFEVGVQQSRLSISHLNGLRPVYYWVRNRLAETDLWFSFEDEITS